MSKETSADLIMKLYDLRREPKMREARAWIITFFPESVDDVMRAIVDESTSAHYRMVTSYWDMAAGFVNQGAIDETMFLLSASEAWVVYSKVEPFIDQIRENMGSPAVMKQLEDLLMRQPNATEILAGRREAMKRLIAARAEMAKSA